MGAFQSGQRLTPVLLNANTNAGATVAETNNATSGTTTSTSYTNTLTTGAMCGVPFTAPPSGKVIVYFTAGSVHNTAGGSCTTSFAVKSGTTVGSGTTFPGFAANDSWSVFNQGSTANNDAASSSGFKSVTGLTPGSSYNATLEYKVTAGTGTFVGRVISVVPTL